MLTRMSCLTIHSSVSDFSRIYLYRFWVKAGTFGIMIDFFIRGLRMNDVMPILEALSCTLKKSINYQSICSYDILENPFEYYVQI